MILIGGTRKIYVYIYFMLKSLALDLNFMTNTCTVQDAHLRDLSALYLIEAVVVCQFNYMRYQKLFNPNLTSKISNSQISALI